MTLLNYALPGIRFWRHECSFIGKQKLWTFWERDCRSIRIQSSSSRRQVGHEFWAFNQSRMHCSWNIWVQVSFVSATSLLDNSSKQITQSSDSLPSSSPCFAKNLCSFNLFSAELDAPLWTTSWCSSSIIIVRSLAYPSIKSSWVNSESATT